MPRNVSTARTWWPTCLNAFAICAPLAIDTSRSELLPPKRTAIFIIGIGINCFEKSKEQVLTDRDVWANKHARQAKNASEGPGLSSCPNQAKAGAFALTREDS